RRRRTHARMSDLGLLAPPIASALALLFWFLVLRRHGQNSVWGATRELTRASASAELPPRSSRRAVPSCHRHRCEPSPASATPISDRAASRWSDGSAPASR